jgi:hypothetical protein
MQRRTIVIASVSGLVGLMAGAGLMLWYLSGPMQQNMLARQQLDAVQNVAVLKELRAGRTGEAQQLLEGYVDAAVIGLDMTARENSALSTEALSTLTEVAKYRSGVAHTPSPIAEQAGVTKILEAARSGSPNPSLQSGRK